MTQEELQSCFPELVYNVEEFKRFQWVDDMTLLTRNEFGKVISKTIFYEPLFEKRLQKSYEGEVRTVVNL